MKCRYCDTELKDGAKFCPNCGKKVIESNVCINCGEQIKPGASFCPHCGEEHGYYDIELSEEDQKTLLEYYKQNYNKVH